MILPPEMVTSKNGEHPPAWPWISIKLHRKTVENTPTLTEYFDECYKPPYRPRGKDYLVDSPWQTHPKRFLRHKALIQAARVVFGFSGIYDEDEAQRILAAATPAADASVVSSQPVNRTSGAADALRAKLAAAAAQTAVQMEISQPEQAMADANPAEPSADKQTPHRFETKSAIAALKAAATLEELHKTYDRISDDYAFSARELPIDIEAWYRDRREGMEQRK